jgi:hypothetical protein
MQQYRSGFSNGGENSASLRTLERNPSGKLSHSPGSWKNYIATDLTRRP